MVQTKKMNESLFVKMQKNLTVTGELIRARQDEKQALLDEFNAECKRFFFGKISEMALASSVKKTNKELKRLDDAIRLAIKRSRQISSNEATLISKQAPIIFRATISGIAGGKTKKKIAKKKTAKKKIVKGKKK